MEAGEEAGRAEAQARGRHPLADDTAPKPTPKPVVATSPKPAIAATPKPAVATTPKPATAAVKPAKKPAKVWVDPFAN